MVLFELHHPTLRLGVVRAAHVRWSASDEALGAALTAAEQRLQSEPASFPEPVRAQVRDVLRVGGYKPTGRGKPASELLLAMAREGAVPRIGNLVDINNLASLESALPISVFDADRLGDLLRVRFGRAGERYVFNASGHAMDLAGLPLICRDDEPVGSAVRDSMLCKVGPDTTRVVLVVYGSSRLPASTLHATCTRLTELLQTHAGGAELTVELLAPPPQDSSRPPTV